MTSYNIFRTQLEKEEFDKLPQLARIEFRQKLYRLENYKPKNQLFSFINGMLFIIGFVLLLAMSFYNINIEIFIKLFSIIFVLFKVMVCLGILLQLIYIIQLIMWLKHTRELFEEYFEIKLDNKKKK